MRICAMASNICSINVFRKSHLAGVCYHIGTTISFPFENLGVLVAFEGGKTNQEIFCFLSTHLLYRSYQQNFQKTKLQ